MSVRIATRFMAAMAIGTIGIIMTARRKPATLGARGSRQHTTQTILDGRLTPHINPNYDKYGLLRVKYRLWKTYALEPYPSNSMWARVPLTFSTRQLTTSSTPPTTS